MCFCNLVEKEVLTIMSLIDRCYTFFYRLKSRTPSSDLSYRTRLFITTLCTMMRQSSLKLDSAFWNGFFQLVTAFNWRGVKLRSVKLGYTFRLLENQQLNGSKFHSYFADALKPQALLLSGGEKDPLEVEITAVNEEEQLERALGDPDKPVPPRVDFRLIGGKIQPELSSGKRNEIYSIHLLPIRLFDRSSMLVFVNVCPIVFIHTIKTKLVLLTMIKRKT